MKKYQTEFKREVVNRFLAGNGGAKLLARLWSVPEEKIHSLGDSLPRTRHRRVAPKTQRVQCAVKLQVLSD